MVPSVYVVAPNDTIQYGVSELVASSIVSEKEQAIKGHIEFS
jgi:hypothetical protein